MKCFFCGHLFGVLEPTYTVRWHASKGQVWQTIGKACESCGETNITQIESNIKPKATDND